MMSRPSFEALPLHPDNPPYSAWGLYGEDDELGTLNLLTPDHVLEAKSEILKGNTINLKFGKVFHKQEQILTKSTACR